MASTKYLQSGKTFFASLPNFHQTNDGLPSQHSFCKIFFKNGPFPASFSLFSSFQYTVDSKQMFNINKFLPMTGFELRTSGIGSVRSTN